MIVQSLWVPDSATAGQLSRGTEASFRTAALPVALPLCVRTCPPISAAPLLGHGRLSAGRLGGEPVGAGIPILLFLSPGRADVAGVAGVCTPPSSLPAGQYYYSREA